MKLKTSKWRKLYLRRSIFISILRMVKHQEGRELSPFLRIIFFILFPIRSIYFYLHDNEGMLLDYHAWLISEIFIPSTLLATAREGNLLMVVKAEEYDHPKAKLKLVRFYDDKEVAKEFTKEFNSNPAFAKAFVNEVTRDLIVMAEKLNKENEEKRVYTNWKKLEQLLLEN